MKKLLAIILTAALLMSATSLIQIQQETVLVRDLKEHGEWI